MPVSRTDESWVKRFLAGFAIVLILQTATLIYWVGRAEARISRNERDIATFHEPRNADAS